MLCSLHLNSRCALPVASVGALVALRRERSSISRSGCRRAWGLRLDWRLSPTPPFPHFPADGQRPAIDLCGGLFRRSPTISSSRSGGDNDRQFFHDRSALAQPYFLPRLRGLQRAAMPAATLIESGRTFRTEVHSPKDHPMPMPRRSSATKGFSNAIRIRR